MFSLKIKRDLKIFGHRGAKGYYPENTIGSFALAFEQGLKWVELDVYNVENSLVVFHDYTLERTTNGQGCIENTSLAYLRSLDAGRGERVPLLDETLDLFVKKLNFNIELKGPDTAELLNKTLKKYLENNLYTADNFIVSSFNHPELDKIDKKFNKGALFSVIPMGYNDFVSALKPYSVHLDCECLNKELTKDAHQRGYKIYAYTVNDEPTLDHALRCQVDGVFTDFPDLLINWLRQRGVDFI